MNMRKQWERWKQRRRKTPPIQLKPVDLNADGDERIRRIDQAMRENPDSCGAQIMNLITSGIPEIIDDTDHTTRPS